MVKPATRLGLSLPNRGVLFGAITVAEIIRLAELADREGPFNSVWVGDSVLAKPRLDSITTLAAIASRTTRVRLGPACFASFPIRNLVTLAYQWASLDVVSDGRTIMVPCIGGDPKHTGGRFAREYEIMGVNPRERVGRMEEGIEALRLLWTKDGATYHGRYVHLDEVSVQPKPVQRPHPPIWLASNPRLAGSTPAQTQRIFERTARLGDGWMTSTLTPEQFQDDWSRITAMAREFGRDPSTMESSIHHMVNIQEDPEAAYAEGKKFLDTYYETDFPRPVLEKWLAYGPPRKVAENIAGYLRAGVDTIIVRFATWQAERNIRRFLAEVLPQLPV
jgi:alkanesulfonate monooxygenase SsuD/methylene tetrahydromethanopterin reductase-like flavin-dependent oxidoreductase (luciferase family)